MLTEVLNDLKERNEQCFIMIRDHAITEAVRCTILQVGTNAIIVDERSREGECRGPIMIALNSIKAVDLRLCGYYRESGLPNFEV